MFEAHLPSSSTCHSPSLLSEEIQEVYYFSQRHKTELYVWRASGKRKDAYHYPVKTLFFYIEYKDTLNISRFICIETPAHSPADNLSLLTDCYLPDFSLQHTSTWIAQRKFEG